jgi:hypothetical protein
MGIKPTTLRLVAQCLNQLRHCVPRIQTSSIRKYVLHYLTFASWVQEFSYLDMQMVIRNKHIAN